MSRFFCKKLNFAGATNAPPASSGEPTPYLSGDPFVSAYDGQLHVAYGTIQASVWDVWCNAIPQAASHWNPQRIDRDSDADKIPVQAGPSIGVYRNQQHFCYIRGSIDIESGFPGPGTIYDSFYDGDSFVPQQIGNPGALYSNTRIVPPVFIYPFLVSIWSFADQQHFTYVDAGTNVIDWFYDGHKPNSQQINNGGNAKAAPGAYSKPFGCVFTPPTPPYLPPASVAGQQHVAYLAADGSIWDAWFDGVPNHPWTAQKLNMNGKTKPPGKTAAPPALGAPCVWVVPINFWSPYHNQQHFTYLASGGEIWDVWYDAPNDRWNPQQLNVDASGAPFHTTDASPAFRNPSACVVGNPVGRTVGLEQHVAYCDATGAIWDLWYDGGRQWQWRKINLKGEVDAPAAIGNVSLCYYTAVDNDGTVYGQLHFAWQAKGGEIWDAWYSFDPIPGQPTGRAGP